MKLRTVLPNSIIPKAVRPGHFALRKYCLDHKSLLMPHLSTCEHVKSHTGLSVAKCFREKMPLSKTGEQSLDY